MPSAAENQIVVAVVMPSTCTLGRLEPSAEIVTPASLPFVMTPAPANRNTASICIFNF